MNALQITAALVVLTACAACRRAPNAQIQHFNQQTPEMMSDKITKTDAEWQKTLTAEQYRVLRKKGTERAFTGEYAKNHAAGVYRCAACGNELFSSDAKFESGTGWPSFYQPIAQGKVVTEGDNSLGLPREEVLCSRCGGHLGHVFDDGPQPTGLRYCINSVSLKFEKAK